MLNRSTNYIYRRLQHWCLQIIITTIVVTIFAFPCTPAAAQRDADQGKTIAGAWYVTRVADWHDDLQGRPFIRFKPDGTLYGSNGCNSFNGPFKFDGTIITFSKFKVGRRTCPGKKNAFAIKFFDASGEKRTVVKKPGHLVLLDQNRKPMMRLSQKREDGATFLAGDSYNQAWWWHRNKKIRKAIGLYSEAIRQDPELFDAYIGRAVAGIRLRRYRSAIEDYRQALRIRPNHFQTFNGLAWVLFKTGDFTAALQAVNQSLDKHETPHALDTRAHILQALGRNSQALNDYRKAIRLGGATFVRLYQRGLKAQNLYDGEPDGKDIVGVTSAIEKCVATKGCDPVAKDIQ